jgi:hypothetical protein
MTASRAAKTFKLARARCVQLRSGGLRLPRKRGRETESRPSYDASDEAKILILALARSVEGDYARAAYAALEGTKRHILGLRPRKRLILASLD